MVIGIDIRLLAKGASGGIPGYTRELLTRLFELDSENTYYLFYNGFSKNALPGAWLNNERVQIVRRRIPNRLLDFSTRFFSFPKIEKFLPRCDVVFSPHFNILKTRGTKHVITFHDLSFLRASEFFSVKQKFWHWLQNYRQQAEDADRILAVSEFTRSDINRLLTVDLDKISVTYPGIGPEFRVLDKFSDAVRTVREKYKLDKPFLLYLGAIEKRKNVESIVRAFRFLAKYPQFKDFNLVLAGRLGFGGRDALRLAKHSGVGTRILFLTDVADHERTALYNLARIFIYPSFFEGFGFPPLEAQACGTPVIAADRTSLSEVLGDSAILIDPWRYGELVSAALALESDTSLRAKIIKAGRANVARFSWQSTAEKTLQAFKQAIDG